MGESPLDAGGMLPVEAPARPLFNREHADLSNPGYGAYGTHRAVPQTTVWGDPREFTELSAGIWRRSQDVLHVPREEPVWSLGGVVYRRVGSSCYDGFARSHLTTH